MRHLFPAFLASLGPDAVRLCIYLAVLTLVFLILEKLWPLHPQKFFRKAFGTDLVWYFITGLVPKLFLAVATSLIVLAVHRVFPMPWYTWAATIPVWVRIPLAITASDIGTYWGHRFSHEIPLLWRFHCIHHSAEQMDWLVNTREHPVDFVFTRVCGLIVLYGLGLAQPSGHSLDVVPVVVALFSTFAGFFIHANVKCRLGWFEWILATPGFHHWHHTNDSPEVVNKNYAATLPFIDKLFGTLYLPKTWPGKYGIDARTPGSVVEQLIDPIVSRRYPQG
jgi:sterol desaturase/sphingolipid hydroxylase (fatty acid hydroxylase superfamily)